ncbi:hypothetical protein BD311DRAFT_728165 [Dichomitus squalens]|uniref:Uncharacterized protein n=1 Tax=Dichomitus squalens TaxID=114155 RepID=A0A4Q9PGS3_9APHY|nr:hypothetical protein BD311DRAFT_728165 [Dichomitus squalens]TBU52522.1 hypothetical protein BD310DRAFT_889267 [Dichomitus squalens]
MSETNAEPGPSTVKEIRITTHGKIKTWVAFALEHFKNHEAAPLVLHTLPASKGKAPTVDDQAGVQDDAPQGHPPGEKDNVARPKTNGLHPTMSTIPRLISVVEIIKREYLKTLDPTLARQGSLSGLHQYNEIGSLEEEGLLEGSGNDEQDRQEALLQALSGRNHLKQKRTAFMRVTLCRKEAPDLVRRGATYQQPAVRKLTKSTRARLKKKQNKAERAQAGVSV